MQLQAYLAHLTAANGPGHGFNSVAVALQTDAAGCGGGDGGGKFVRTTCTHPIDIMKHVVHAPI